MLRIVRQPLAEAKPESLPRVPPLLQLRVLCLGFLEEWDLGVGVFPEGEEILVGGAGGGDVSLEDASARQTEMGKGGSHCVARHCSVIENVLEFPSSVGAISDPQIGQASGVNGRQSPRSSELVRASHL